MAQSNPFDCPICWDFYSDTPDDDYFLSTDCGVVDGTKIGHVFHHNCLVNVLSDETGILRCPICRSNLNPNTFTKLHTVDVKPKPNINDFDHELKIVVLGRFRAGKSCIVKRFSRNIFEDRHIETVAIDYFSKSVRIGDRRVKLNLWDTGGQEKYQSLVKGYLRNAFGMIFVYDITNRETFDEIMHWVHFADDHGPLNTKRILVGNKVDLENERQVSIDEAQEVSQKLGYTYLECSAKEGFNIPEIFRTLTVEMLNEPGILVDADRLVTNFQVRKEVQKMPALERVKIACC